ncbi:hypothetical protein ACFLQ3_00525 [Bacteroidota bacterium]
MAQSPNSFNYQVIIRDADAEILSNENVEMELSIVHGTATGMIMYTETFNVTTNQFGLVSLKVGTGSTSDNFNDINWSEGVFFLKTVVNGNEMGTTQLLSVPYAKFADMAGNTFSGNYNDLDNKPSFIGWDQNESDDFSGDYNDLSNLPDLPEPIDTSNFISIGNSSTGDLAYYDGSKWKALQLGNEDQVLMIESGSPTWKNLVVEESIKRIGEFYLGGIIYYVSPDGQHGLIACMNDLDGGSGVGWSDITSAATGASSFHDGNTNTDLIIAQGAASSAAQLCRDLGSEWYLPSAWELHLMHIAAYEINKTLDNDGDSSTNGIVITNDGAEGKYWSSTEYSLNRAWSFMFNYGYTANSNKTTLCRVRGIRAF